MSDEQAEMENNDSRDVTEPAPDVRIQRIEEYLEESLQEANPLVASLGAVNTDLLFVEQKLGAAVNNTLDRLASTLDEVVVVLPTLEQMLKLSKQIGNFAQLQTRLKGADQAAAQAMAQAQSRRQADVVDTA